MDKPPTKGPHIAFTTDSGGFGTVCLDGVDWSESVAHCDLQVRPGRGTTLQVGFHVNEANVQGAASAVEINGYYISDEMARAFYEDLRQRFEATDDAPQLRALAQLVQMLLQIHPWGGLDGGDLQEILVECGILEPVTITELPCGENCDCLLYAEPGATCYRPPKWVRRLMGQDEV